MKRLFIVMIISIKHFFTAFNYIFYLFKEVEQSEMLLSIVNYAHIL